MSHQPNRLLQQFWIDPANNSLTEPKITGDTPNTLVLAGSDLKPDVILAELGIEGIEPRDQSLDCSCSLPISLSRLPVLAKPARWSLVRWHVHSGEVSRRIARSFGSWSGGTSLRIQTKARLFCTSVKYSDFHISSDATRKHYGRLNAQNATDTT